MRKTALVVIASGALWLSGCATTSTGPNIDDIIAKVRSEAAKVCGFVPLAATVAEILAVGNPALAAAGPIAAAICRAVTSPGAARGARVPTVNGVPVRGQFI